MALFESYERRIDKINAVLNSYGIASLEAVSYTHLQWGRMPYRSAKLRSHAG